LFHKHGRRSFVSRKVQEHRQTAQCCIKNFDLRGWNNFIFCWPCIPL